jgi:Haem-binding uptake, Tiki superfamily, ChaN
VAAALAVAVAAVLAWSAIRDDSDDVRFRPAVEAVVSAAKNDRVVLLGEIHQWPEEHRFFRELVADPALRDVVDDVVVEFGNARFQPIVDAYIRGDSVDRGQLSRAWTHTTQDTVWLAPDYAAFFQAIREQNRRHGPERQLRVVLGDPPIRRRDPATLDFWVLQREIHFAYVVQREVIARGRRALVIAGVGHVLRRAAPHPTLANLLEGRVACSPDPAAVAAGINWCDDLERFPPVHVRVVVPHVGFDDLPDLERKLESEPRPSTGSIEGTWLAELPLATVLAESSERSPWTLADAADEYLLVPGAGK